MRHGRIPTKILGALFVAALLVGAAPPDAPVADAAMEGDAETVRSLIREGADVNAAQGDGMTGLHWAAERGDPALARILLSAGADVDAGTRIGAYTPLHLASRAGSAEVVRLLLEAGADPSARTSNTGAGPLHLAAASGDPDAIALLVEHGAGVNEPAGIWEQTPLVFAAAENRVEAIEALLERGADPSITSWAMDVPRQAALDDAAQERLEEVLDGFREAEADEGEAWTPSPTQVQAAIEASREIYRSPPEDLEGYEDGEDMPDEQIARYPDLVGSWGGLTPLLHAVRQGHTDAALALLDGGADIDQVSAGDGTSPLLMASINGQFDLATVLLERGADPDLASNGGMTPLHAVLERQWAPRASYAHPTEHQFQETTYIEVLEALLEAGAEPNRRLKKHPWHLEYTFTVLKRSGVDFTGATPFWQAAHALDVDAMRLLVEHGADPHIPTRKPPERRRYDDDEEEEEEQEDPSGVPEVPAGGPAIYPIHAASGVGYGRGFAANAHRHAPDGWMPAVKYLVEELGADVNRRDHEAYVPLHHAASRGDNEMIRYLVEHGADVTAVSREGQTTADMANGPYQRIQPFPATVELLEELGSKNNHNCVSC